MGGNRNDRNTRSFVPAELERRARESVDTDDEPRRAPIEGRAATDQDPLTMALLAEVARNARTQDFAPAEMRKLEDEPEPGVRVPPGRARRATDAYASLPVTPRPIISIGERTAFTTSTTPTIKKITAATFCVTRGSSNRPARLPTNTASPATHHSAAIAATITVTHARYRASSAAVPSCVRAPHSAMKITPNVVASARQNPVASFVSASSSSSLRNHIIAANRTY